MSIAFDTLAYSKRAQQIGFKQEQAEFLAKETAELITDELVTRDYLDNRLTVLQKDLMLKLGGMMIGCTAAIISILGFILHVPH
jgi:hypothetical protein